MSAYVPQSTFTKGVLGNVTRKTAATLVTNSTNSLFTITGGLIVVTSLLGIVTTEIPNTASLTIKLVHTPSGGSAGDLSAATGITADAVGTFYTLPATGIAADLVSEQSASGSEAPNVTFGPLGSTRLVLGPGAIGVTVSNHTSTPGAVKWYCTWVALDEASTVVAA